MTTDDTRHECDCDWCGAPYPGEVPLEKRHAALVTALGWALDYIERHGGIDNKYRDIERWAFARAALDGEPR